MRYSLLLLIALFALSANAENKIYVCKDASGKKSYQNKPCENTTLEVKSIKQNNKVKTEKATCEDKIPDDVLQIKNSIDKEYQRGLELCQSQFKNSAERYDHCISAISQQQTQKLQKYYAPHLREIKECRN